MLQSGSWDLVLVAILSFIMPLVNAYHGIPQEEFKAIFPLGVSLNVKNTHWPSPHPLVTPLSSYTFAPEGANFLCSY